MLHTIHELIKTILLAILVVYAAVNYQDRINSEIDTQYNSLIDTYLTFETFTSILNYQADQKAIEQYRIDSMPTI